MLKSGAEMDDAEVDIALDTKNNLRLRSKQPLLACGKKYTQMLDFLMAHAQTVQENMVRKARIDAMAQPVDPAAGGKPATSADSHSA